MAKTTQSLPFDLTNVTAAFADAERAANSFDAMTADMVAWHAAGIFPSNDQMIAALMRVGKWSQSTCKVYASNLLKWARSGQTPRNIAQVVKGQPDGHVKGKGGRPAGTTGGTQAQTTKAEAANDHTLTVVPPKDPRSYLVALQGMNAGVNKLAISAAAMDKLSNALSEACAILTMAVK